MQKNTFDTMREFIYQKAGITLGDKKEALVTSRIGKRMRQLNIETMEQYCDYVTGSSGTDEIVNLLDVISTNVTHFFRESRHFDFLSSQVSSWLGEGKRKLRIWSAGCSTGEEPYSIAMTLNDLMQQASVDFRILATDLSTRVLDVAAKGTYADKKMEDISSAYSSKFFRKCQDQAGYYRVTPELRKMISFSRLNLTEIPFPMKGPFDVIFCRNVMIYFDNPFRQRLLKEYERLLCPGGFLLVGHAESLTGLSSGLKSISPAIYQRIGLG